MPYRQESKVPKMSDNSDLLGGSAPEPTPQPRPRGRPRKTPVTVAPAPAPAAPPATSPVDTAPAGTPEASASTVEAPGAVPQGLIATDTDVTGALVDAATAQLDTLSPEAARALADMDLEAANRKAELAANPDAVVTPAAVSTEYARAQATRITMIGQPKREYGYQRLMRSGKRL